MTRHEFYVFEARLRAKGFSEDQEDGVICRWRHDTSDLILDAMPAQAGILGFENRWQGAALPHAIQRELPSGQPIRAASPPYLLATKLEAFKSRGNADLLESREFGDVIAMIDGRPELVDEVLAAEADVRGYIAEEFRSGVAAPRLGDGLAGAVRPDAASQARVDEIIMPAIRRLSRVRNQKSRSRRINRMHVRRNLPNTGSEK